MGPQQENRIEKPDKGILSSRERDKIARRYRRYPPGGDIRARIARESLSTMLYRANADSHTIITDRNPETLIYYARCSCGFHIKTYGRSKKQRGAFIKNINNHLTAAINWRMKQQSPPPTINLENAYLEITLSDSSLLEDVFQ